MDYSIIKYILIGDTGVGKSSILSQYTKKTIEYYHMPTIGIEYGTNMVIHQNKKYKLQIWDTAGQEIYRTITRSYYRNANCIILVFDVSNRTSFNNLPLWITDITDANINPIMILVGNKSDKIRERQVPYEEGIEIAKKNNMLYIELSANNYEDVYELFKVSYTVIIEQSKKNEKDNIKIRRDVYKEPTNECCLIL